MSEKYKQPKLPTPEQIQDEELWLLDRQADQAKTMDELGITHQAIAKLSDFDSDKLSNLSRPSIHLSSKQEEDGTVTERVSVRFSTPGLSESGHNTTGYVFATVVEATGDSIAIEPEFTLPQAEAAIDIVSGLKQAKDLGVLPHLSSSLSNINNPMTYISAGPSSIR